MTDILEQARDRDPGMKAEMQLHILDGMADVWAEEVDLVSMIKAATSPMDLNKNVPPDVKEKFRLRMEAQIDAIARQSFLEGAHRAICMVQDVYNPIVIEQRARILALAEPKWREIDDEARNGRCIVGAWRERPDYPSVVQFVGGDWIGDREDDYETPDLYMPVLPLPPKEKL